MSSLLFESLGELSDYLSDRPGVEVVDPGVPLETLAGASHDLWLQPSVRKVAGFIARNVASIPLHVYERMSDQDRRRVTDHPLATVTKRPAPRTTSYRFWELVFIDWLLHDRWCVIKQPTDDGGMQLARIPVRKFRFVADALDRVVAVKLLVDGRWVEHDPDGFIFDRGYARVGANGTSPAETLKQLLAESAEAVAYRRSVWKNGARVPLVIERPAGAPQWGPGARNRFKQSWQNFVRGGGREGGTPILEDGMKLAKVEAFSPQDAQDLEGRKLTDVEVATAYHIAPELLGIREGTYSNVEAFRQSLYRDALGPYVTAWEQTLNAMLTPELAGGRDLYVEAHVEAKLRGSFEEQAQILSTATGRPWMVTDEARARMNMPALGGDAELLVTPLNVTVGGLASPRDTGDQNRAPKNYTEQRKLLDESLESIPRIKALEEGLATVDREVTAFASDLASYQLNLADAMLRALDAKQGPPALDVAFDVDEWNGRLAATVGGRQRRVAQAAAVEVLDQWNPDGDGWSADVMDPWLTRAAQTNAARANQGFYDRLAAALMSGDQWREAVRDVLLAADWAETWATTLGTEAASFGRQDAAAASGLATKTWMTTSSDPRDSHRAMSGETVGIEDVFSNGARWPGDWAAGADEVVNCRCRVDYGRGDD